MNLGDGPLLRLLQPGAGHPEWDPKAVNTCAENYPRSGVMCQFHLPLPHKNEQLKSGLN